MPHALRLLSIVFTVACVAAAPAAAQPAPVWVAGDDVVHSAHAARIQTRSRHETVARSHASPNFDATYYDLQLDLDFDSGRIAGLTRVRGRVVDEVMRTLRLDLAQTMQVSSVRDADESNLSFIHENNVLAIDLGADTPIGGTVDVYIDYGGVPAPSGLGSFTFGQISTGPIAWTLSEPYGAREWWPGRDHPSDKADSVRITVTVPEGLRVGSNGLLVRESTEAGRSTFEWMHRYPIASYLVAIAAGPYAAFEDTYVRPDSLAARLGPLSLPVLHYVYDRGGETVVPPGWADVIDMLAIYEHWFGPYPFSSEKYGHIHFTWPGGMEHQTMSSMGGGSHLLVAHEVAHQWYGNLVTLGTWPHLWLNEGFASYAELLYWEAMPAQHPGRFQIELETDMSRARSAPGTLVVEDTLNINNLFNANRVYAKGSVVLHMLRRIVGDAVFREILQAYASDPAVRYGTAVTADFQRIAEDVSDRDLDAFFHQWVTHGVGYPIYEVSWRYDGDDETAILVTVAQTQTPPASNIDVFRMPLTLLVETETGNQRFVVENDARMQEFRLQLSSRPVRVTFDPDLSLLRNQEVTVTDTDTVHERRTALQSIFPNPTNRHATVRYTLESAAAARVRLFDALGREVLRTDFPVREGGAYEDELDLAGLAAGTYVVRLEIDGQSFARTLVVSGTPR